MKGRSSSNERQKFGTSLPDNRSQTAADLTSFNSRPFSPPPSSIIIESSGKNEDGEASERGRRRRGGRQRKGRRGERWSRNRYGIGSSVFAVENQKGVALILLGERRQTSTTIADRDNETMEWVALAADSDYRARFLEAETEKRERERDEPTLDERLLRYLLCARALVIMRLASRGSQRIRDDAQRRGPLRYAQSSAFSATAASPDFLLFRFATIPRPRPIG